jgi:hypothetical protein
MLFTDMLFILYCNFWSTRGHHDLSEIASQAPLKLVENHGFLLPGHSVQVLKDLDPDPAKTFINWPPASGTWIYGSETPEENDFGQLLVGNGRCTVCLGSVQAMDLYTARQRTFHFWAHCGQRKYILLYPIQAPNSYRGIEIHFTSGHPVGSAIRFNCGQWATCTQVNT